MLVYRGPLYRNKDFFVKWPSSFFFFIFRDEDFFLYSRCVLFGLFIIDEDKRC